MATTTQLDQILKTLYLPPIQENFNRSTVLLNALRVGNEQVSGTEVVTPLWYGYSQGVGARAESGTLPAAKKSLYKRSTTSLKTNYGRVELTGHLIRATRDDRGSFIRAIGSEIQNMSAGIKNDYNRQCFGDGTGAIAKVRGADDGTDTTLLVDSNQYLKFDMDIAINYTGSSMDYNTVSALAADGLSVTLSESPDTGGDITVADDSLIYRGDATNSLNNKDAEIMGLKGLVYDTTSTIQSIAPATNSWWKPATGVTNTSYANLEDDFQTMFTNIEKNGGSPDLFVVTYEIRDKFAAQLQGDRRYMNVMDYKGGFKALEFNGLAMVPDTMCQDGGNSPAEVYARLGMGYMLDTSTLSFQAKGNWDWMDMDGAVWNRVANKDAYEATIFYESNMVCTARNRNCAFHSTASS